MPKRRQLLVFRKEESGRVFRKNNNANTVWTILYVLLLGYKTIQIIPVKLHYPVTLEESYSNQNNVTFGKLPLNELIPEAVNNIF